MKTRQRFLNFFTLLMAAVLAACSLPATPTVSVSARAWIDQPVNNALLPLAPFTIRVHASRPGGGIVKMSILVNSVEVGSGVTDPSAAIVTIDSDWTPAAPGVYTIQAVAMGVEGQTPSEVARVCVSALTTARPLPGFLGDCGGPSVRQLPGTTAPAATPPLGSLSIALTPSSMAVNFGGCDPHTLQVNAALSGDTSAVSALNLNWVYTLSDGSSTPGTTGTSALPMMPGASGTYTWSGDFGAGPGWGPFNYLINLDVQAVNASGAVLASASLTGIQWLPCPLTAPGSSETLVRTTENPQRVFYGGLALCPSHDTVSTATFTAELYDPASAAASVQMVYYYLDSSSLPGASRVLPMTATGASSPFGGRLYSASLDVNNFDPVAMFSGGIGVLVWSAQAVSATGNAVAQSTNTALFIHSCRYTGNAIGINAEEAAQPTFTPGPAMTDTPTLAPTDTATTTSTPQQSPFVIPHVNAFCRKGPGTLYNQVTVLIKGTSYAANGRNSQGSTDLWWLVQAPGSQDCWVGNANVDTQGPVEQLAIVQAPPLPGTPGNFGNTFVCDLKSKIWGVTLTWVETGGETGYRIYLNGALLTSVDKSQTTYKDVNPPLGVNLVYELEAYNSNGVAPRSSTTVPACK